MGNATLTIYYNNGLFLIKPFKWSSYNYIFYQYKNIQSFVVKYKYWDYITCSVILTFSEYVKKM